MFLFFYEYNQNLFNNRISQFLSINETESNDNQLWLNEYELNRLSIKYNQNKQIKQYKYTINNINKHTHPRAAHFLQ